VVISLICEFLMMFCFMYYLRFSHLNLSKRHECSAARAKNGKITTCRIVCPYATGFDLALSKNSHWSMLADCAVPIIDC
jgi:hypothetical protein